MQSNIIDRSSGNYINIIETFPGGNITTIGHINGDRFDLTITTRSNDGEEIRESVTGMTRNDGSQYNVYRNTLSHQRPFATRESSGNEYYQNTSNYAAMQFTQPKKFHNDSNNDNWGMKSIELKW